MRITSVVALLAPFTVCLAFSCSKDNVVDAGNNASSGVGAQCAGPGDPACGTGGVCVLGYCRLGCTSDGACPQGALCLGDVEPYGCSLSDELSCSDVKPCKTPLTMIDPATVRIRRPSTAELDFSSST